MIYLFDLALPMPTKDLYDTAVMQMAIAAAKDMYDRGEKRIDDFYKKYEDFYSPIAGATEDVYNTGIGKIKSVIDNLYALGIDPVRSAEGRAAVRTAIRSVDVARINARKQEADFANQYIKNRNIAIMNGTYDPDVERAVNGGKLLEEWTAQDGYWHSTAPIKYMSQDELISPLATALTPEFDPILTASRKDGYDYSTVSEDRIRKMVNDNLDDLITKSAMGKYYYDQALKATNNNPDLARQMLAEQYVQTAKKYTKEDRKINQYAYQKAQADERRRAARELAALEYHYKQLGEFDLNGDGKISDDERNYMKTYKLAQIDLALGKSGDSSNIFRAADAEPRVAKTYKTGTAYENKIDPANHNIVAADESHSYYHISREHIEGAIENGDILTLDGKRFKKGTFSSVGDLTALPTNQLIKINGKYYIYARLNKTVKETVGGKEVESQHPVSEDIGGSGEVLIRVKEREGVYNGKKDKKS